MFICVINGISMTNSTFSVRLSDDLKNDVDKYAALTKRSRSYIVQEAIAAYMKDRLAYLDDLNEAIADAQSGYAHSSEQIFAWMDTWGTENETPLPEPDITPHN